MRLLTRTTRSVAPTQAGERLLQTIGPRFEEIDAEVAAVRDQREKPAGTIRITATEYAADAILLPKLAKLFPKYPDIKVEIIVDYGLSNIVADGYDAGVRSGEQVARDMIAVPIGPDLRMAVVGAPSYFRTRPEPKKPQDLVEPQLHQPSSALAWWRLRVGIRESRPRAEGTGRRSDDLQRREPDVECRSGRTGSGLYSRRDGGAASRERPSQARARATGVSRIPAITCSIQAGGSLPRPSTSSSTRCAIAVDDATPPFTEALPRA